MKYKRIPLKQAIYIACLMVCFFLTGCNESANSFAGNQEKEQSISRELSQAGALEVAGNKNEKDLLEVHFIDVGQGDAILIKQGEEAMLVDAGNNDKGTIVWGYLRSQKVEKLTYGIGTHTDADHIGGLDVVLYKIPCEKVLLPNDKTDTKTYEEFMDVVEEKQYETVVPRQGAIYPLGEASFQILTNTEKDYENDSNNSSIAFRLTYGNTSFLLTGDAEEEAEEDMLMSGLSLQSDVYKVAHHGANNANSESFLQEVLPRYSVISCGEGNSYGHPRAEVMNRLREMGVLVFRTDEQGTIVAISNGETIIFNTNPSITWKAGEPIGSGAFEEFEDDMEADEELQGEVTYILNLNTKKFHRLDCISVLDIKEKNKQESMKSRDELIQEGYSPCGNCKP